jgi:hypothetical protein
MLSNANVDVELEVAFELFEGEDLFWEIETFEDVELVEF